MDLYILMIIGVILFIFVVYLFFDMGRKGDFNMFLDKWADHFLFLWLPVYGIYRLTREVILKKRRKDK